MKDFAEHCLSRLIGNVTKKSAFYREANENLLVEKANLRMLADELARKKVLDSGEFFSVRRRLWAGGAVTVAVLLTAVLDRICFGHDAPSGGRLGTCICGLGYRDRSGRSLVGGGLAAMERLLESLLWHRRIEAQAGEAGRLEAVVWGLVLFGIELALLGILDVRASLLAQQTGRPLLYASFLSLGRSCRSQAVPSGGTRSATSTPTSGRRPSATLRRGWPRSTRSSGRTTSSSATSTRLHA